MGELFYLFVFSVSAALVYIGNRYASKGLLWSRFMVVPGLLIPVLLAGFRNGVGKDFFAYSSMIENLQAGQDMYYRSIEPFSAWVVNVAAQYGEAAGVVMFTLFSFLTISFAYIAIKRMAPGGAFYVALAYFLYICAIFPTTLNAVRSGVAVSLMMLGFSYLVNMQSRHRFLKFILSSAAAVMFHTSALLIVPVGVVVFWATRNKRGKSINKIALLVSISLALAFPLVGDLIANVPIEAISNYSKYLGSLGSSFALPIYTSLLLVLMIMALIITKKNILSDEKLRVLHAILMYYIPMFIVIGWMSYYPGISRLGFFFDPIVILVIAYAVKEIVDSKKKKHTVKLIAAFVIFGLGTVLMFRSLDWSQALPYQTIFSEEVIYESKD